MERVRAAFDLGDVELFASVLDPRVRWLAPDLDPRHGWYGVDEVVALMDRAYRAGVRAEVLDARQAGTRILLATRLVPATAELPSAAGPATAELAPAAGPATEAETTWRLLTVERGRVVHIQDCLDRREAERLLAGPALARMDE